ncbi:beta strand repeat-containing protein [Ferruginibacter albus]|uniref:beta strand repeat-containing protein n=1 Tax=Ferruginibacter albus TaxID=2875540 RepID=UPI001CC4B3C8|nr:hypothetical protein [Ferruginibacter albus]UAY52773.1 hypothetical protein K9M53_03575 [Ferruginibacter albus]
MKQTSTQSANVIAKRLKLIIAGLITALIFLMPQHSKAQFTDGNLVVFKNANYSGSNGSQIELDEYNTTSTGQSPVSVISLPTTGTSKIVSGGSTSSNGAISRSENGRYILVPGWSANVGDANSAFTLCAVRPVSGSGTILNGITGTSNWFSSSNDYRGATSDDGTNFWVTGGSKGILYTTNGTTVVTVSATSTNTRTANIFNSQLYFSTGSGTQGVYQVGTGKPTSNGTTSTILASPSTGAYGFAISPDFLTLYTNSATGAISRWTYSGSYSAGSYSGGSWSAASTGFSLSGVTGLAVDWSNYSFSTGANGAIIYACNTTTLVKGSDNGTGAITTSTLATASGTGTNAFKQLAFTPIKQTVSLGSNTPAAGAITTGTSNVVLFQFNVNADEGNSTLKKVIVNQSGTATIGTGNEISNLRLIDDANGNGVFDGGETVLSTGTVAGSNITFASISLSSYISQSGNKNFLVIGDVSNSGNTHTFIPSIVSNQTLNSVGYTTNIVNAGSSWVTIGATPPAGNTLTITGAVVTPTKLAVTSITPSSPLKNNSFSVTIQSQDGSGNATNVTGNTGVQLSLASGTGNLGGTLTGTINAGSSSVTISNVTYNKAESGVSVTATRTSGDALTAATSATFTVLDVADHLTLVSVPSSGTTGNAIASFTVEARRPDNTVDVNYTSNIIIAKASGSGTLSGTLTNAAVAGVATFTGLSFSTAGTYTLSTTSGSLTSATSGNIVISDPSFTSGNLAVLLMASASSNNTTGSIVELNTSTPGSNPVNTFAINGTSGAGALRFSASAASMGYLANNNDKTLLCIAGFNGTTTSGNANTFITRGVGTLNAAAAYTLQATYTGTSGQQVRGATELDNSARFWMADQSGLYTNGTTTASPTGNLRSPKAFGGIVYVGQQSATAIAVNTISAPSGGTLTALLGVPADNAFQDFYLISSANNNTYDILYTVDNTNATTGAINKYSLVSGSWTANGTYTTSFGGFGLAAEKSGGGANLYVSTGVGTTANNSVIKLFDAAGYNSAINITTGNNVTLYTATSSATIKGVAFAPVAATSVPSIAIAADHPAAGNVLQGVTNTIIGAVQLSFNSGANEDLTGVSVNTAGTYSASDVDNFRLWLSTSATSIAGATQLGGDFTSIASGGTLSASGIYSLTSGTTYYIVATASISSGAQPFNTVGISGTAFSNIGFFNATKTGTDPVAASNLQTIQQISGTTTITNGAGTEPTTISSITNTQVAATANFDFTVTDDGESPGTDASATQISQVVINAGGGNTVADWSAVIAGAVLTDGTNTITASAIGTSSLTFSSIPNTTNTLGYIADNGIKTYSLKIWLKTSLGSALQSTLEGQEFIFDLQSSGITINGGSQVAQGQEVSSDPTFSFNTNIISVVATKLAFTTQPVTTAVNATMTPSVVVAATDANGNIDIDFSSSIRITSSGSLSGTLVDVAASQGTASFDLVHTAIGTNLTLTAVRTGTLDWNVTSSSFNIINPLSATEIILPSYMQGNSSTNSTRVPYSYRMAITGLLPNSTYKYINQVVTSADGPTTAGAGNAIYAGAGGFVRSSGPSLSSAGNFGTFTTDASGNYTGWFITEPTGNARFTPGNDVYMRVILNDGAGGSSAVTYLTTTNTVHVINFAASAGANNGTALRGTFSSATAKNFILLYDNITGSGRPLAASFIESDGSANTTANSYASFYNSGVEGITGAFGTIVPNNNANGIRRIEQRTLATADIVYCVGVSEDGTWTGAGSTVNPTGGATAIVFADADLDGKNKWVGGTASDWNTAANWSCGAAPNSSSSDAVILASATPKPILNADIAVGNIAINGSSTVSLNGNTLSIGGAVSGTGTLSGSSTSNLTITGTAGNISFTSGAAQLQNLTLNSGAAATLATALRIAPTGSLEVKNSGSTTGVLTTGSLLTLASDANGAAYVKSNTSGNTYVSGAVTVERFIPSNGTREWRMLSIPTQTTQSINESWQEGQASVLGLGTIITAGPSNNADWASKGFDALQNYGSLLSYNQSNNSWDEATSTLGPIAAQQGYFIYIRGDRTVSPSSSTSTVSSTTLRTAGSLFEGNQQTSIPANKYTLLGNKYVSSIDFTAINKDASIDNSFIVWDPKLLLGGSLGHYQTFSSTTTPAWMPVPGGGSYGSATNTTIEAGQAFFVHATNASGNVTLTENSKTGAQVNAVFRPVGTESAGQLITNLYANTVSASTLADENVVAFNANYSNAIDVNDVVKFPNVGENLGIAENGKILWVEGRQAIATTDTLFYAMNNVKQQQYQFEFIPTGFSGVTAYLLDNYLGTKTPVSLLDKTTVSFTVTSDAASSAADRFSVVFDNISSPVPVRFTSITAAKNSKGVDVMWSVSNETGIKQYVVESSVNGYSFTAIGTVNASDNTTTYNYTDANTATGAVFYRVKSISLSGEVTYTDIVKVATATASSIKGYFTGSKQLGLQLINQPSGKYAIKLTTITGQEIFSTQIDHAGGSSTKVINAGNTLAQGVYQLEVVSPNKTIYSQKIITK